MIIPEITYNLDRLRKATLEYAALAKKSDGESIRKQSGKLAWNIYRGLIELAPEKGAVRAERLAALRSGQGVHVRDAVLREIASKYQATSSVASGETFFVLRGGNKGTGRAVGMSREIFDAESGKMLNFRAAAVKRELSVRESARKFTGASTPRPSDALADISNSDVFSRYGFQMSEFALDVAPDTENKYAMLRWFGARKGDYESPVESLSKAQQTAVLNTAVAATVDDTQQYIDSKLQKLAKDLGLS